MTFVGAHKYMVLRANPQRKWACVLVGAQESPATDGALDRGARVSRHVAGGEQVGTRDGGEHSAGGDSKYNSRAKRS